MLRILADESVDRQVVDRLRTEGHDVAYVAEFAPGTDIVCMCDRMNYVADTAHADAYERQVGRRGVLFTLEQAKRFVADTAANRMWRYDWPPARVVPQRIIAGIKALGVDVSNWGG